MPKSPAIGYVDHLFPRMSRPLSSLSVRSTRNMELHVVL